MKICILYGGTSSERAVSLNTGESIYNAISNEYQVTRHDFNGNYSKFYDSVKDVDLVFNALHGGDGEDGTMQKYLESKDIKFTGSSSAASEIAMNKDEAKLLCVNHEILTPSWLMFSNIFSVDKVTGMPLTSKELMLAKKNEFCKVSDKYKSIVVN